MEPVKMSISTARAPLEFAKLTVDAYEEGARFYWRLWGPFGQPAIRSVEQVAQMQRMYLTALQVAATPFSLHLATKFEA